MSAQGYAAPEKVIELGKIAFSELGGIRFEAEYWPNRPHPSLRITRTARNGRDLSFSISPSHASVVGRAVQGVAGVVR